MLRVAGGSPQGGGSRKQWGVSVGFEGERGTRISEAGSLEAWFGR